MKTPLRLTIAALGLAILSVSDFAVEAQFSYTTNYNGTLNLSQYSGTNPVVDIPSTNNGLAVTSIGSGAFDSTSVTSVTIPNGVLTIHADAFDGCASLTNVTIPNSVTSIESYVFDNCSKLSSVTIPNSLTSIQDYTFYYCSSLTNITIPASVTYIGDDAFYSCTKLTSIYFEGNAPSVGSEVFGRDHSLTVYYLAGTTGWATFSSSTGLTPVLWQPQTPLSIANCSVASNQLAFTINGTSNLVIVVEATTDLANATWTALATNNLSSNSAYFSDPQWRNYSRRFYRLRSP